MADIEVEWVDADRWSDLEVLFGRAGASNGCWCQYWLLGAGYHRRDRAQNRRDLRAQVRAGSAGLLAYRGGEPIGWARLTPRSELEWLAARFSKSDFANDHVWSLPCFFVSGSVRGEGVMTSLIRYAAQWGRSQGRPIEAYPIDPGAPGATRNRFSGVLSAFVGEGFTVAERLAKDRVVVRSE